jgi:hypothetical protein
MESLLFALTFLAALGAGLIGGLFFAFFVFRDDRPPPPAIGNGHFRHAVHQCRGPQSVILRGFLWDCRSLLSVGACRAYQMAGVRCL